MDSILIVTTSLPKVEAAETMAHQLIEHRLAACVQIQNGIHSVYRWDGKICDDAEVLLVAKTGSQKWLEIESFIKKNHPYQLPEILAFTPSQCSHAYGTWVLEEVACD
jgi:periplasmic divalent cation tolerance protein